MMNKDHYLNISNVDLPTFEYKLEGDIRKTFVGRRHINPDGSLGGVVENDIVLKHPINLPRHSVLFRRDRDVNEFIFMKQRKWWPFCYQHKTTFYDLNSIYRYIEGKDSKYNYTRFYIRF